MIKEAGIDFVNLPDEDFDTPDGRKHRCGRHLRRDRRRDGSCSAYCVRSDHRQRRWKHVDFTAVRGMEGVKEATVKIGDLDGERGGCQRHRQGV